MIFLGGGIQCYTAILDVETTSELGELGASQKLISRDRLIGLK